MNKFNKQILDTDVLTASKLIFLNDEINAQSSEHIISKIYEINEIDNKKGSQKREPIKLIINSDGGEVYYGLGIIDVIELSKTPIYTVCHGHAMSMAFAVFCAGEHRIASSRATFMYHESSYEIDNEKVKFHEQELAEIKRIDKIVDKFVMSRTKITSYVLSKIRKESKNWYIDAKEALKYRIINEII